MKNELIQTDIVTKARLDEMVENAIYFYQPFFDRALVVETTPDGFDIMLDEYELGSYGIRECEFLKWIYGTACAEPRTSKLITLYQR